MPATRTHNVTTTHGATCDGMTVTTSGVDVDGFQALDAQGLCLTCEDVAYSCDECGQATCVNALYDTPERFLCEGCFPNDWTPRP